jgi:hypothetical protein
MEQTVEKIEELSEKIKAGDNVLIAGQHAVIREVLLNNHDEMVWRMDIVDAKFKSRSKMTLIIPKKLSVTTWK